MRVDFCCMHSKCTYESDLDKLILVNELTKNKIDYALVFYDYPTFKPSLDIEAFGNLKIINGISYNAKEGTVRIIIPDMYYRPFSLSGMNINKVYSIVKTLGGTMGIVKYPMFNELNYDYLEFDNNDIKEFESINSKRIIKLKVDYFKASRAICVTDIGSYSNVEYSRLETLLKMGGGVKDES